MAGTDVLESAFMTLPELVRRQAAERPRHKALVQDDLSSERSVTCAELDALMDRIAAALQRDGVRPQESIAVCGANSIEYAALFFGALRAGVAIAPLAPSSTPESLARMVEDSG